MNVINEVKKVIEKEKYDMVYHNVIDKQKVKEAVTDEIPEEFYNNIIVSFNHYDKVLKGFQEWEQNNKEKKIEEKYIVYPYKDIMIIKDDTIQYNP